MRYWIEGALVGDAKVPSVYDAVTADCAAPAFCRADNRPCNPFQREDTGNLRCPGALNTGQPEHCLRKTSAVEEVRTFQVVIAHSIGRVQGTDSDSNLPAALFSIHTALKAPLPKYTAGQSQPGLGLKRNLRMRDVQGCRSRRQPEQVKNHRDHDIISMFASLMSSNSQMPLDIDHGRVRHSNE
jgi:hypothetical protein